MAEASINDIAGGFVGARVFSSLFEDCELEPPHPAESIIVANAIYLIISVSYTHLTLPTIA